MKENLSREDALKYLRSIAVQQASTGIDPDEVAGIVIAKVMEADRREFAQLSKRWTRAYLRKVLRTTLADSHLTQREVVLESAATQSAEEPGFEELEMLESFANLLTFLDEKERSFAILVYLGAVSGVEDRTLARLLGVPPSTFSSGKLRIISKLSEIATKANAAE